MSSHQQEERESPRGLTAWQVSLLVVLFIGFLTLLFLRMGRFDETNPGYPAGDPRKYIYMAENGAFDFHIAPFCYRPLFPLLASLLPFDTANDFTVVTAVSLFGALVLLFALVREKFKSNQIALALAGIGASSFWFFGYFAYNVYSPDSLALCFTLGACLLLLRGQALVACVVLAIGIMAKDSVLLAIPLAYGLLAKDPWEWDALRRVLPLAGTAAAAMLAIRLGIPAHNLDPTYVASLPSGLGYVQLGTSEYSLPYLLRNVPAYHASRMGGFRLFNYLIAPWGPLSVVLMGVSLWKKPKLIWLYLPFFLLLFSQLLVAVSVQRVLASGLPALLLIGGAWLSARSHRAHFRKLLVGIGWTSAFTMALTVPTTTPLTNEDYVRYLTGQLVVGGVGLCAIILFRRKYS